MVQIPVYVFTGFLDSGKTKFIQETLEDERNMKLKIDRASQVAYEQAMEEIRQELSSFCTSRGADYITICTDQPVEKVLFKELLKVGIMA